MPFPAPPPVPLDALPPDGVAAALAAVRAALAEFDPAVDVRSGPLADLLLYPEALLAARAADLVDRAVLRRSLDAVAAGPDADPDAADAVLSNFRLARRAGGRAAGPVTVVLSADTTVVVPAGAVWRSGGRAFRTPGPVLAKVEAAVGAADRVLRPLGPGRWAFDLDLVADADGPGSALRAGEPVAPDAAPPAFVSAAAAADFAGGRAAETAAGMLTRLRSGLAAAVPSNRATAEGLLRDDPATADAVALSVVGFGDPEMRRDRRGPFPVSLGGRVDWHLRTAVRAPVTAVAATAVCDGADPAGRWVWRVEVGRDAAPGAYEVAAVRDPAGPAGGKLPVLSVARGADLAPTGGRVPDVADPAEAAFSRFQTLTVRVEWAGGAAGDERPVTVEARGLPLLAYVQDRYAAADRRHDAADLLVKAPVPVFVTAALRVLAPAGAAVDPAAVRAAVALAVAGVPFGEGVAAGRVYAAALGACPPGCDADRLALAGRLVRPDGPAEALWSDRRLDPPADPARGVSPRTVQFFCDPADVTVLVAAV